MVQNHDARTTRSTVLQLMGAEQHDLTTCGQFLDQATQDQRRADIETGKRLVQQEEIGLCRSAAESSTFWRIPFEISRNGRMPSPWKREQRSSPSMRSAVGFGWQIAQLSNHDQVFKACEMRLQMRLFGYVSHALLVGDRIALNTLAVE